MSFSDWLHNIAIGGCLASLLLAPLTLSAQENKTKQKNQTKQPQAQQQAPAPQPPPAPAIDGPKPVETDWNKVECAKPKNHDEADLCEQRRMSKAAENSVVLNTIQIGLGIIGAFLVLWSLYYTRGALKIAAASTKTAGDQVELSRLAFIADQRPWLSVKPALASDFVFNDRSGRISIDFAIRNTGNSPALNIMINCHFIVIEDESEALLERTMAAQTNLYSNLKRPDPMTIGHSLFPQDDLDMSRSMSIDRSVIDKFTKGDPNGGFSPVLVGSVSYRSPVDKVIHHTGFIYDLLKPKPDERTHPAKTPGDCD